MFKHATDDTFSGANIPGQTNDKFISPLLQSYSWDAMELLT
jgi:hypothetical protein